MKALGTLIRLAREEMELVRRALAESERLHARALTRIADLDSGIASEQAAAARHAVAWSTYGGYAAARSEDRRALSAEEAETAAHAIALRARLSEAHVELKKLEKLAEMQAARRDDEARRRERIAQDEIAMMAASRKGR